MRHMLPFTVAISLALFVVACKSSQEGVKTNYMKQWTTVNANTTKTTEAAKAVLEEAGLKEVTATSTNVDGKATAKKADGTKVTVSIARGEKEGTSDVSVSVGTMGDPSLGSEIARKTKMKAEEKADAK